MLSCSAQFAGEAVRGAVQRTRSHVTGAYKRKRSATFVLLKFVTMLLIWFPKRCYCVQYDWN
jgi:hypothetical protein